MGVIAGGDQPNVVLRTRIELADPANEGSKQPYHAVEGLAVEEARKRLSAFEKEARELAAAGLRKVLTDLKEAGYVPDAAGILDSSGRKAGSLESILASHALIHAAEGDHFREALAHACARAGLGVSRVPSRDLIQRAGRALGRPAADLEASMQGLRKTLGPPWDADHKSAALLAWLLLDRDMNGKG